MLNVISSVCNRGERKVMSREGWDEQITERAARVETLTAEKEKCTSLKVPALKGFKGRVRMF